MGKEIGKRPEKRELDRDVIARIYFNYWESLFVENGVLYKKWISSNLKTNIFQLVVPQEKIQEILKEAHDSPYGGHFEINKTLERIRKRFGQPVREMSKIDVFL